MSSDTGKFFTSTLYFSSECNFHLFLCWSSSDILLSSDWILGLALSYAGCTYETRYWAWPPPMQFEHMGLIGPHRNDYFHDLEGLGLVWLKKMVTHHSSLSFHHPLLITQTLFFHSLKIKLIWFQFPITNLTFLTQLFAKTVDPTH